MGSDHHFRYLIPVKKVGKEHIVKLEEYLWEIPTTYRQDMQVPARILATEILLDDILDDRSLNQLVNVTTLPGIQQAAYVMPDVHEGYGFPIGGVAATLYPEGAITPGGIGYDINCGVQLLRSSLFMEDIRDRMEDLSRELYSHIPSGMGKGGNIMLSASQMEEVLSMGAEWAVDNGYAEAGSLNYIESHGKLPEADPGCVSNLAKSRGSDQLGTIGSGNHFVEADEITEVYDEMLASAFGIKKGQAVMLIHTGSRGLGHQVATDHIRIMMGAMPHYGISVPDRELACVPFASVEGQAYFRAMCAAANFAWCNRLVVASGIREAWHTVFGDDGGQLEVVYDVAHNIAKIEHHEIDGKQKKLIVHRKGATRSFGPKMPDLPEAYQEHGQPVIVPGSMGTHSYLLAGTGKSHRLTFGSCCHGAGRQLSRTAAKRQVNAPVLKQKLKEAGIFIEAGSFKGIAEEAPVAYKDVDLVIAAVAASGVAKKVARLRPVAVVKG